jgi:hypothetical protein
MITPGTWFIFPLTIEGSYLQNLERPAQGTCDSFQYWITPKVGYDIRTFAIDRTTRVLKLDLSLKKPEDLESLLLGIARRTYKGIIEREIRIHVTAVDTSKALVDKVSAAGLFPHADWTALDFPLWLPEHADYRSLSE